MFLFALFCFVETGSDVAQAGLELPVLLQLTLDLPASTARPCARITGVSFHSQTTCAQTAHCEGGPELRRTWVPGLHLGSPRASLHL